MEDESGDLLMARTKLVIGASGFLGSHVTKQLVARGEDVRVMIRSTSSTQGIDGLPVDIHYGDIFDTDAVRAAMQGCDVVYYCVVDARAWLRDPGPLWRTNVEGLRNVLDVAVDADLYRFVFTSSIGTIGRSPDGLADEDTAHNWLDVGGDYIRSRVAAEDLVVRYCTEKGLPGVAMCVANTFGPGDWLAVREACPVLLSRLSPPESSPGLATTTPSAPELIPVAANPFGAGTVGVPAAPFLAPPSSLLSLELL